MKRLSIRIDDELHKALKLYCLETDETIQDLAVEALKEKIKYKVISEEHDS